MLYEMRNAGEEKKEPPDTISGNVNWRCHSGEQCGGSPKNEKKGYHLTQQSHSWIYIQRKL